MNKPLDNSLIYRKKNSASFSVPSAFTINGMEVAEMENTIKFILKSIVNKHSS